MKVHCRKRALGIAIVVLIGFFSATVLSGFSFAQTADFPKKEITILVAFAPGGARDIIARGVGNVMSRHLGVPMVVNNMPGAGGARGMISLYHAAPDGYTIGVGTLSDIISQVVEPQDFDCKKFTYIGYAQHSTPIWYVKWDSPFRTIADFKKSSKPIRHSTPSMTQNSTIGAMIVANRIGFPMVIVGGYKSTADSLLGVIRGEAEFCHAALNVGISYVRNKQIRPILAVDRARPPEFPDTQTIGEAGHPDLEILATDYWFMGPPGVPKARQQILETALVKTLKDPEFLKWAKTADVEPKMVSSEDTLKNVMKAFGLMEQYKGDIEKYLKQ